MGRLLRHAETRRYVADYEVGPVEPVERRRCPSNDRTGRIVRGGDPCISWPPHPRGRL